MSLVVIIIMLQQSPQPILKPLLVLTLISAIFCIGLLILTVVRGYAGYGSSYTASSVCNTYLLRKYETQINVGHEMRLIGQIIALLCLGVECGLNIRSYLRFQQNQAASGNPQLYKWSQYDVCCKYVGQSLAILAVLPTLGYYVSITVQEGKCWQLIKTDWLLFAIGSAIPLVFSVICWIMIVKFAVTSEVDGQENNEVKIDHNEIREKGSGMKNVFDMEGAIDMYKTNKNDNRQAVEPLLVENSPIPLFQSHLGRLAMKDPRFDPQEEDDDEEEVPTNAVRTLSGQQAHAASTFHERKRSNNHEKEAIAAKKNKIAEQILKKKQKFREINPFKSHMSPSKSKHDEEPYQDDLVDPENKMKNLPKGYGEYIREAKRPKRNTPSVQVVMEIINKEAQMIAKLSQEKEKPFLKKYRQTKQIKNEKKNDDEIQFIEQNEKPVQPLQLPDIGKFLEDKMRTEGELFYHKPKIEKNLKKRKALFDDDVTEGNQYIPQSQEKDVIINKLKQAKGHYKTKHNSKLQGQQQGSKSPKRKNVKTKEDILVNFLRSKFNVPNEDANLNI